MVLLIAVPAMAAEIAPSDLRRALAARVPQISAVGGDVTLLADRDAALSGLLARRPESTGLAHLAIEDPALGVTFPAPTAAGPLGDSDLDGVPDRVELVIATARATLRLLEEVGLAGPIDDGDGELDLYLLPLGNVARGYVGLEQPAPGGRGVSGFVVVNIAHPAGGEAIEAITARLVARLALLGIDRRAPGWWIEPSVAWFELQVTGPSLELASAVRSRWSRPELGLQTGLSRVARGNLEVLLALEDREREARALRETWTSLAERREVDGRDAVLLAALMHGTGYDIAELQARAAVRAIVDGLEPTRWSAEVEEIPAGGVATTIHAGPWGGGLVSLRPDPLHPAGTRLEVRTDGPGWAISLIALRHDGRWERVFGREGGMAAELLVPWSDYQRAVAVLIRDGAGGRREAEVLIDGAGADGLFALASVSARRGADGSVEIAWRTGWERDLFGWIVERAPGPGQPFVPLDEFPAPSLGGPDAGAFYRLRDPLVPEDVPAAYRIVAVTRDGLRISGPVVVPSH